jgi:hypothetical protein
MAHPTDETSSGETLARALAAAHDALAVKIALLEAEQAAGTLAPGLAGQQAAAAQAAYDRDCALARVEADFPRWQTWVGMAHLLYARIPMSSPPIVVRAATAAELRAAVQARDARLRP